MNAQRTQGSTGAARNAWVVTLASLAAIAVLVALLRDRGPARGPSTDATNPLLVFCAAGIKVPVEAAARDFERETGERVQLQYGGSGTLLGNLRVAEAGDVYVPADASYIEAGRGFGVLAEVVPLARQRPVILVAKGNPKGIRAIEDLGRDGVRVSFANPEAASVGRSVRALLQASGRWTALEARIAVFKPTVNDVANDVKLGAVDAGIVWDALAAQYPDLDVVRVPAFDDAAETLHAAVLKSSRRPTVALRFLRFLAARDRGAGIFAASGYEALPGDAWVLAPEISLFSGSMLRPGVEATLKEFEAREGCRITTVYNGCGILCAQMRAGERPDAYLACDTTFMDSVADLYGPPADVVDNSLMIIVQKGNPKGIATPADLAKPGVRVGLPHHDKSAMGNVAWRMLVTMGLYDAIAANLAVESPTGDFLVNQLRTGSLDAILACRTNYRQVSDTLDALPIDHPMATMTQPFAVGKDTPHAQMVRRLLDAMVSGTGRERFEKAGFGWRYRGPAEK